MSDPVAAEKKLGHKIRSAYLWVTATNLLQNLVGFGISVVLARLLQPSDYGLVGMVIIFIAIFSKFQELGFGQALVHFDEDPTMLPTYFTVTTLMAVLLTVALISGAPAIANFYQEPRLTPVLRALSFSPVLAGLQVVPNAILTKAFRFRTLSYRDLLSTVVAGVVSIMLAFRGFGVWALVANMLVWGFMQAALLLYLVRPSFGLRYDGPAFRRMFRYGLPLTGASLLNQFYDNADYMVIGRLLGTSSLGYYTVAFRLASLAHEKLGVIINRVAFPSFAAMQKSARQVLDHWLAVSRNTLLITGPILAFIFVSSEDLLVVVFGTKWQPAGVPLRFLCVMGVLRSLVNVTRHLLNSLGKTALGLQFAIFSSVVMPLAFAAGCVWGGLKGVGIAWAVAYPVCLIYLLIKVKQVLPLSFWQYVANLRFPAMTVAILIITMELASSHLETVLPRLAVRAIVGCAAYALCVMVDASIREETFRLLRVFVRS